MLDEFILEVCLVLPFTLCLGSGFSVVRQRSQAAGVFRGFSLGTGFDVTRPLRAALAARFLIVLFRFTVALSWSITGASKTTFLSDQ